jgi:hypothetical protein
VTLTTLDAFILETDATKSSILIGRNEFKPEESIEFEELLKIQIL